MDLREKRIHGAPDLPVAVYETSPGGHRYFMDLHWHPEHEIVHVESGELALRFNGQAIRLVRGDTALIPGGTIHTAQPTNCRYACILTHLPLLLGRDDACREAVDRLQSGELLPLSYLGDQDSVFSRLCREMLAAYREGGLAYPLRIKGLLLTFFGSILAEGQYVQRDAHEDSFGRLKPAVAYMEEHYSGNLRLSDIADHANMTPNHFCKCFKALSGMTPFAYITRYRLKKARHALQTTDMNVTETALACGFNDISHFIRLFRQEYGVTPKQFCKSLPASVEQA